MKISRSFLVIILFAIVMIASFFCGSSPAALPVLTPTAELAPAPTPTPTIQSFTGNGQSVIELTTTAGLVMVSLAHEGDGNFIVWVLDDEGNQMELLANKIGDFNGQRAFRSEGGDYIVEVNATGNWAIEVRQ